MKSGMMQLFNTLLDCQVPKLSKETSARVHNLVGFFFDQRVPESHQLWTLLVFKQHNIWNEKRFVGTLNSLYFSNGGEPCVLSAPSSGENATRSPVQASS